MATDTTQQSDAGLTERYDKAASAWGDKMRTLGYYDAYLGFLSSPAERAQPDARVLDVGCGTGAFAEAWAAIHGRGSQIALLDPSEKMLDRAAQALIGRGLQPTRFAMPLDAHPAGAQYDDILAAHVIEHYADPQQALAEMRGLAKTGATLWLAASKPHWCNAIIWFQWRHRTFQPGEVERMLRAVGWEPRDTYSFPSGPPSRTSRGYVATAV